jgi:arylsulfatase A
MRSELPNIVFIMADDMGYGDVGCYNPESKIPTPNMDRLAAEGVRFTDAHSPSAVCTPTRYGVLTGRYCWRSKLKNNVLYNYEHPLIDAERTTVASMLKNAGYATACVGKWHLGLGWQTKPGTSVDFEAPLPWPSVSPDTVIEDSIDFTQAVTGGPNELGFDYAFYTSGCSTAQPPYCFLENDRTVGIPSVREKTEAGRIGLMTPGWKHRDADPTFARKAVEAIEGHASAHPEKPLFLYFTPSAPHEPAVDSVVPDFMLNKSQAGSRGDLVALFDWMVGEVLDTLDRCGMADNTLVIVTSDNGALAGDRGRSGGGPVQTYDHKSCGDLRGYKAHIWEGGHREPFLARWPGKVPAGTVSGELLCLTDFLATCAAIVDQELPSGAGEDSYDMLPALLRRDEAGDADTIRPDIIHHSCFGAFSIRRGDYKLILDTKGSGGWPPPRDENPVPGSPGQLYNIKDDPYEERDLWEERPAIVAELTDLLETYRQNGRSAG